MPDTGAGTLRHAVTLETPGVGVPDSDGGSTAGWSALAPLWWASIQPATARDLERTVAGTVLSTATHLLRMRYLPGVTTQTRITKGPRNPDGSLATGSREFSVTGIANPEERNVELVLVCVEVVP